MGKLSTSQRAELDKRAKQREERSKNGNNKCYNCGGYGHHSKACTRPQKEKKGGKGTVNKIVVDHSDDVRSSLVGIVCAADSGWYSVNATKTVEASEWLVDTGANVSCIGSADQHLVVGMIDAPSTRITTVVGTTEGRHAHLRTPVGVVRGLVVEGNVGRILCFGDFVSKGGRLFIGGGKVRIAAPRGRMVDARLSDSMQVY